MWWKALLALLSLFEYPPIRNNEENAFFRATPYGPQSMSQAKLAHAALYGGHEEMIENPKGAGIRDPTTRWPGYPGKGVIAYTVDQSLDSYIELIERAMEQYHKHTCIRFVKKTNETDYVRFIKSNGCFSQVGRIGGIQGLSLGQGCDYVGTIVHELGHAVGLYHEHQRYDRDKYITVYKDNVQTGQEHNFQKYFPGQELIFTNYDYGSIMHYGEFAFSKEPGVLKTMKAKNGEQLIELYDKPGLSKSDIETVNKLYKCK